jgi:predicted nucleic acid-binding protein
MNFVLDNSVVVRWLLNDGLAKDQQYAKAILSLIAKKTHTPITPGIWSLEIANVISRAEKLGQLDEGQSTYFLETIRQMRIPTEATLQEVSFGSILHLSRVYKLSSYDCSYLELAMRYAIPIATLDKDLIAASKRAGVVRLLT